ncbi:hypothetical protein CMALT430_160180 [Carnobacterium maltaromaticum]|uniref:hypothetical protein n=1 Tax=Carnobacterium maltaromaticum TaxID=2751 RepID=UPI00191BAD13|nr:hypothetical protein [Carnobacterium maltaromaticum]CAD5897493.1 hypothetical protein CMALT430_160180 [Carnobacterium maltaromaticum]
MGKELWLIYEENQYYLGVLALLAKTPYKIKMNTLEMRFFVVNQNNKFIYLDKPSGVYSIKKPRT